MKKHFVYKNFDIDITFLCVGIGLGFPTFLSMELRQVFHNGNQNIPPLFLANNYSPLNRGFLIEEFISLPSKLTISRLTRINIWTNKYVSGDKWKGDHFSCYVNEIKLLHIKIHVLLDINALGHKILKTHNMKIIGFVPNIKCWQ